LVGEFAFPEMPRELRSLLREPATLRTESLAEGIFLFFLLLFSNES